MRIKELEKEQNTKKRIPAHLVPKSRFSLSMADNFIFHPDVVGKTVCFIKKKHNNNEMIQNGNKG